MTMSSWSGGDRLADVSRTWKRNESVRGSLPLCSTSNTITKTIYRLFDSCRARISVVFSENKSKTNQQCAKSHHSGRSSVVPPIELTEEIQSPPSFALEHQQINLAEFSFKINIDQTTNSYVIKRI